MSSADPRAGLALGTPVRSRRATLKRMIAAGELDLASLIDGGAGLLEWEETALSMRLTALVLALPGVGDDRAAAIFTAAQIPGHKVLGALPIQRRRSLADAIRKETHD